MPIIIVLAILAVGGIGLSIYSLMQLQAKDNQISSLNSEIAKLKQSIEELENIAVDADGTTIEEANKDNIIVDDWKIKIKVPESISITSYTLNNETWLSIIGSPVSDKQKMATIGLVRVEKSAVESGNAQWTNLEEAVFLDDVYAYYLMYTNTTPERDLTTDKLIMEALSNSELYSKIK